MAKSISITLVKQDSLAEAIEKPLEAPEVRAAAEIYILDGVWCCRQQTQSLSR